MGVALTVNVVLLDRGEVLLTRREDFEVWCAPGGHVDPGESVTDAALREMREETGHDVVLDGLVGVYSAIGDWPDMHACVFAATPSGAAPSALGTPDEVVELAWHPLGALPDDLLWWHEQRIADAAAGRRGLVVEQRIVSRLGRLERHEVYAARDASGSSRATFFRETFPRPSDG